MDLLDSITELMRELEQELVVKIRSRVPVAFDIGAHILNSGGKRIRPQLTIIAARLGGYYGEKAVILSGAIEAIHTATLLHDDVVDHADTRRGLPSANTLWSNEMCVLGGDFMLARAFLSIASLDDQRIFRLVCDTTARLSEGELFQMSNIGNIEITEDDYLQIVVDKTAVLMEAACRGGAILGNLAPEQEEAIAKFGFNLGIAFQMTDDVIDYRSEKEVMGKNPGNDLEEGKLTLPLIIALKNADPAERQRIESMTKAKQLADGDLLWVREFLERRGGIEAALEKGRDYLNKAREFLEAFPDSEEKQALNRLADRILHRTY